jgi:glycosyltransferase involved in cell wall biosynthesis
MRIGLVTGEYPPDRGGVGDFTSQLGHALADLGHEVYVITTGPEPADPTHQAPPVTVHRVVDGWAWRCWRQVAALAEDLDLDVLDVQYQAAAYRMHPAINFVPRARSRPPVAVTFHDLKVPYLFPKAGPLRWWVVRTLARRADAVIVTNSEDQLRLQEEIEPHKLKLIPIGSNIEPSPPASYDRDAERARWGVKPDGILLGYFGFLNESKGGEELINALHLLVEQGLPAHLLKVGGRVGTSDPTNRAYAEKIERLIADLGLIPRVHWTGYARPAQISAALLATDVCVLPYRDGASFRRGTLLACLAHGRATVTTRPRAPLPEVRDGETMLLVEPRDPSGLAQAVTRLALDPELRARLEANAEALAADFTWDRIARRTAAVFDSLARDNR